MAWDGGTMNDHEMRGLELLHRILWMALLGYVLGLLLAVILVLAIVLGAR